jgi:hypothetical protein
VCENESPNRAFDFAVKTSDGVTKKLKSTTRRFSLKRSSFRRIRRFHPKSKEARKQGRLTADNNSQQQPAEGRRGLLQEMHVAMPTSAPWSFLCELREQHGMCDR